MKRDLKRLIERLSLRRLIAFEVLYRDFFDVDNVNLGGFFILQAVAEFLAVNEV